MKQLSFMRRGSN